MTRALIVSDQGAAGRGRAHVGRVSLCPPASATHSLLVESSGEERDFLRQNVAGERSEWREVVDNPDPATVGSDHQILLPRMNLQIPNRYAGEVSSFEFRPALARVDRNPEAKLGPHKEEVRLQNVLLDYVCVTSDALLGSDDPGPALAEIGRPIDPRSHVSEGVAIESGIGGAGVESACPDPTDPGVPANRYRPAYVRPGRSPLRSEPEGFVIGPRPDHLRAQ